MNVGEEEQVEKGVADVAARYGRIDVLVSNAGSRSCIRSRISLSPTGRS
jgi:NAD(P)-dependent dehydrogenase (short-subunit alcohol dehydrogenase family)